MYVYYIYIIYSINYETITIVYINYKNLINQKK